MPVITQQDVIQSYQKYAGRAPTQAEINQHTGQTVPNIDQAARNFFGVSTPAPAGGGESGFEFPAFGFPEFPGMSAEEKALVQSQTQLVQLQMQDLNRQNALNAELFPLQKALYTQQLQFATELFPQQKAMIEQLIRESTPTPQAQEIQRLSEERALASLQGKPIPLSPEQTAQLDTIYGESRRQGQENLRRFAEEMAAGRGLRLTDTPIGDVALREARNLESNLGAARAQSELDLGQSQQAFSESVRQFQAGLQQQAMQNRLALAAGASNQPSLSPVNAAPLIGSLGGLSSSLASNRAAQAQYGLGYAGLGLQQQQFLESINQANLDRISRERIAGMQFSGQTQYRGPSDLQTAAAFAPVAAAGINTIGTLLG